MNGIEIWSDHGKLLERWVLQDGVAMLEEINTRDGEPHYPDIDGVEPIDGERYLKYLKEVVDNSTFLVAKRI